MPEDGDGGPARADRLELTAPGVVGGRRPGRRRACGLARRRRARAPQDDRRRADHLGLVPDGAVRGSGARRRARVRRRDATGCRRPCRRMRSTGRSSHRRWALAGESTIATELGPDWPFRGRAVQRFELGADHLTCRLELHADEPMPASIGWHPYFLRRPRWSRRAGRARPRRRARCSSAMPPGSPPTRRSSPAGPVGRLLPGPAPPARPALAGLPRADGRERLPGLGRLHGTRGRDLRRAADRPTERGQHAPDGRAAGRAAHRRDDLALAVARRAEPEGRVSRRSR